MRRPTPTNLEASFPPKEFAAIEARLPTGSSTLTKLMRWRSGSWWMTNAMGPCQGER